MGQVEDATKGWNALTVMVAGGAAGVILCRKGYSHLEKLIDEEELIREDQK